MKFELGSLSILWGGVSLSPLDTLTTLWYIVPALNDDEYDAI
jgi:hypothetical protein